MLNVPVPTSKDQLKRYLGTLSYNSKFIQDFGNKSEPFYHLLKKKVRFHKMWSEKLEKKWKNLTETLKNFTVLQAPIWNEPFCLAVDASDYAAGAAVFQLVEGQFRFVELGYKIFNQTQKEGWHSSEKEIWSVAYFLDKYDRYFLSGTQRNHIFSDAELLKKLFSKKQINSKMMRYRYRIANYKVTVHHLVGDLNTLADFLSRDSMTADIISNTSTATTLNQHHEQLGEEYEVIAEKFHSLEVEDDIGRIHIPSNLYTEFEQDDTHPMSPEKFSVYLVLSFWSISELMSSTCISNS